MKNNTTLCRLLRGLALLAVLLGISNPALAQDRRSPDFDHLRTGFPLAGAHAQVECQACHVRGVFKGTPRQCDYCHTQGSRIASTAKPANHVPTTLGCDQCHTSTVSWVGARFRHTGVVPGSCMQCHNGTMAQGKHAGHVMTTASCDTCHRTTAWVPAGYNHTGVAPGSCITCHNGTTATGKHAGHVATTASCDSCHRTTAWIPAGFDHTGVAPGTCNTCHNGTTATGKHSRHIPTTGTCDQCHRTTAWQPSLGVTAVHAGVTPGTCSTCHNGNYVDSGADGKSGTHFVTSRSCDNCHNTTSWTPARYTHSSPYYSPHNSGVTCTECHEGKTETITWRFAAYTGFCAGCHFGKFKPDPHKKTEVPTTIFYTADELKNCSGSCHQYTDSTFSTILKSRSGEHRSTDGGF